MPTSAGLMPKATSSEFNSVKSTCMPDVWSPEPEDSGPSFEPLSAAAFCACLLASATLSSIFLNLASTSGSCAFRVTGAATPSLGIFSARFGSFIPINFAAFGPGALFMGLPSPGNKFIIFISGFIVSPPFLDFNFFISISTVCLFFYLPARPCRARGPTIFLLSAGHPPWRRVC